MDLFSRGKSKGKKKTEVVIQTNIQPYANPSLSPKSPHPSDDYFIAGHKVDGSSTKGPQSSSIPITDHDMTGVDLMTDAEVEDYFEKMLIRRGIHDTNARLNMTSFPVDKKRIMVAQDIQAETASPSTSRKDKKVEETKGPEYYVKKLSDTSKGINAKVVSHLAVGLRTMPLRNGANLSVEGDLLKCFKALLNNRIGAREALNHPQCVQEIVNCIISPSLQSRRLVCEVLVFMCYYEIPVGQDLVLKAMDKLRDNERGLGRFDAWLDQLENTLGGRGRMGSMVGASEDFKQMAAYGSPDNQLTEYVLYNIILVNAIINVVEDVEIRIHLRNQMTASGLERVLDKMKELSDEHVDRQIREFKALAENDQDELMDMYHDHVLNDKDDPREIFEYILTNVEGTRAYDFFLSCLQHLLLVNNEESSLRSRYFQIIDNLVAQVVLDHKGLAGDFTADYNTTVQHLLDRFADQDQLKTTLEDLKELQVHYAEIERERDVLRSQLSHEGDALEIVQLREKTASLEDLLRMSRHTISTLQKKLRDLQNEYDANLEQAGKQFDEFYKFIDEDSSNLEGNIVISRKDLATAFGRIRAQESLEGHHKKDSDIIAKKSSVESDQNKYKSIAAGLSEDFKSQLARQFGSSNGLGEFVLPGTMPLMGSAVRRSNNRKRQVPSSEVQQGEQKDFVTESYSANGVPEKTSTVGEGKDVLSKESAYEVTGMLSATDRSVGYALNPNMPPVEHTDISTKVDITDTVDHSGKGNTLTAIHQANTFEKTGSATATHQIKTVENSAQEGYNSLSERADIMANEVIDANIHHSHSNIPTSSNTLISNEISSTQLPPPPPPPPPPQSSTLSPTKPLFSGKPAATINQHQVSSPVPPPPPPPPLLIPGNALLPTPTAPSNASIAPPPPPPPPSTGIPPPPPPGAPSAPNTLLLRKQVKHLPTVKTRQLQWQKLNANYIQSTIWKKATLEEKEEALENMFDAEGVFKRMEEIFAQKVIATKKLAKKEKRQEICIIDPRKAYNISIAVLAKYKNISFKEFKRKLLAVDERFCTEVLLKNLLMNAPSHDEMGKLSVFMKTASEEDLECLSKSDSFCAEIMTIDRFKERLTHMLFVTTFHERISQLGKNMTNVMDASTNLKESEAFIDLLNIILMVGNFLNGTNFQGGAFGIRISSINKLVDTRASTNDTTLLHFLCTMVEEKFPTISQSLVKDLELCGEACRVTIQDLIKDYNELRVGLQTLIHELECNYGLDYEAEEGDNFAVAMYKFRDRAIEKFDLLEVRYTSMDVAYKDVVSYFGEDPSNMKPDEFFGIFQTFLSSWKKAKGDIELQRKKKEQAEKSKQYQEQRKALLKNRLDIKDGPSDNQEDKDIMDNLLEKLRSGEMGTAQQRRSRRMSMRERRKTKTESMVVKAEDLLRHIQNDEEAPPLPKSRSNSKRIANFDKMKKLASLAEQENRSSTTVEP